MPSASCSDTLLAGPVPVRTGAGERPNEDAGKRHGSGVSRAAAPVADAAAAWELVRRATVSACGGPWCGLLPLLGSRCC